MIKKEKGTPDKIPPKNANYKDKRDDMAKKDKKKDRDKTGKRVISEEIKESER